MRETLEFRKKRIAKWLAEELAEKPRKWWQPKPDTYKTTAENGAENVDPPTEFNSIIRYDLKGALRRSALFILVLFSFCIFYWMKDNEVEVSEWLMFLSLAFLLQLPGVFKAIAQKPQIIVNQKGIWLKKGNLFIPWKYLTASYIKEERLENSVNYYLLLYYYDETTDEFPDTCISLAALEKCPAFIADAIEYWKIIQKNSYIPLQ